MKVTEQEHNSGTKVEWRWTPYKKTRGNLSSEVEWSPTEESERSKSGCRGERVLGDRLSLESLRHLEECQCCVSAVSMSCR